VKTLKVSYRDDEYDLVLTVRQATILDGMRKAILDLEASSEIIKTETKDTPTEVDAIPEKWSGYLRFMVSEAYPCCVAAIESIENAEDAKKILSKDMTFNEFADLPDALFQQWRKAVYKLNPHWIYKEPETKKGEENEPANSES